MGPPFFCLPHFGDLQIGTSREILIAPLRTAYPQNHPHFGNGNGKKQQQKMKFVWREYLIVGQQF